MNNQPEEAPLRRQQFVEMARSCEADLLRMALRLCHGNRDQAQDLVQDTLVRAYEAFVQGRLRHQGNTHGWFLRILTNNFLSDNRRRVRWESGLDLEVVTGGGDAPPASHHATAADRPEAALLAHTLDEPLERALTELPPDRKLCVILVDLEGMDYAQAAEIIGVPIGTLRSRLARARLQLFRRLKAYGLRHHLLAADEG